VRFGGGILRDTVAASAAVAALALVLATVLGRPAIGAGLAAGLLIGAFNGHLVAAGLAREVPFVVAAVLRMVLLGALGIGVALLLGGPMWSVLIGVATAQVVMVAASIRLAVRA
jgi:hypothetical protein